MNASAMQTATVTVKYVGPPKGGKQYGFIKAMDNSTWPVKADRIREFEADNEYEIAWTEASNGFKNIIGVKRIVSEAPPQRPPQRGQFEQFEAATPARNGAAVAPAAKPAAQANGFYRPTAPRDSERMFVCAIAGHWIDTGRVDMTEDAMVGLVTSLRAVYARTFGADDAAGG